MKTKMGLLALIVLLLCSGNVWANVNGQCSDCHTMHNSQDGDHDLTKAGAEVTELGRALTKGDCIGCHTGVNGTDAANIPYVVSTAKGEYGPDYVAGGGLTNDGTNTLAGGTFNYVTTADANGHNVAGLNGADVAIGITPPGWIYDTFNAASGGGIIGAETTWASQLTCAGTYGCHGDHKYADDFADITGAHHSDDSTIDGATVAKSYRFLRGILGVEDADWEHSVSATDHNIYKGVARTDTTTVGMDKTTISYLCAQCHGLFHGNDGTTAESGIISSGTAIDNANPWLRHPTDFSLNQTSDPSEYRDYVGADGSTVEYNFIAPLASSAPTLASAAINAATINGTDDIVTCISCHRAHGSEYADMLRWDYANVTKAGSDAVAGFDNKGCFACHTSKD